MVPWTHDPLTQRLVLIDFDWEDADLMPDLLRRAGISVRLVAGEKLNDAGVRVAELCGVRSTIELADLTREIFDLALVGERSPRRGQVERLLRALGTPIATPRTFLGAGVREEPVREAAVAGRENGEGNGHGAMSLEAILARAI